MSKLGQLRCALDLLRAAIPMSIWIALSAVAMHYIAVAAGRLELGAHAFQAILGTFSIVAGFGGLWFFWRLAHEIGFWMRGYDVRYVKPAGRLPGPSEPRPFVYEERDAQGRIRSVPFGRRFLDANYPPASELHFPAADVWDTEQPDWARGRRAEIVQRAKELCGPAARLAEDSPAQS